MGIYYNVLFQMKLSLGYTAARSDKFNNFDYNLLCILAHDINMFQTVANMHVLLIVQRCIFLEIDPLGRVSIEVHVLVVMYVHVFKFPAL